MNFFKNRKKRTEQELIEGCKKNDRKSQNILYERFAPLMLGICIRYSSELHVAEDIMQEGFIRIYNCINPRVINHNARCSV